MIFEGTHEHAVQAFAGERAHHLVDSLRTGWSRYAAALEAVGPLRKNRTRKTLLWELMQQELSDSFSPLDGVEEHRVSGDLHVWLVDDFWGVLLKTHDAEYRTHNLRTPQQTAIRQADFLPELGVRFVVTVGPRIEESWSEVADWLMVRHAGRRLEWIQPLDELAGGAPSILHPTLPLLPAAPAARIITRRSADRSDSGEQRS